MMIFHRAIRDYETLCAVAELEDEIDGCETLIEALESRDGLQSPKIVHDLRARARYARTVFGILYEEERGQVFDA